jgi:hypothetical protein
VCLLLIYGCCFSKPGFLVANLHFACLLVEFPFLLIFMMELVDAIIIIFCFFL